jgi:hypothetical protein
MTTPFSRRSPLSLSLAGMAMLGALFVAPTALAAPPEEELDADPAAEIAPSDADDSDDADDLDEPAAADVDTAEPVDDQPAGAEPEGSEIDSEPTGKAARDRKEPERRPPASKRDPKHSVVYTSLVSARINPLGLEERLWIGYQRRLYSKNKTILNGSNVGIMFRPIVSPAIALLGATLQFQPAAVLRLRATYSYVAWFGTFQFMQSHQSPHDDWSESRLRAQADNNENYSTTGQQVELEALVQARFKQLALRSTTVANYNSYKLRGDDDLFYDIRIDALVPNNGWVLFNDTDLIWLQDIKGPRNPSIIAGGRVSVIKAFYPDRVYEPGDVIEDPNGPQLKVGPELGYVFYDRPQRNPRFNRPTLLLIPQWNILHRYRTGRDVSTALPTIAIAFVFTGQLWAKN